MKIVLGLVELLGYDFSKQEQVSVVGLQNASFSTEPKQRFKKEEFCPRAIL